MIEFMIEHCYIQLKRFREVAKKTRGTFDIYISQPNYKKTKTLMVNVDTIGKFFSRNDFVIINISFHDILLI